MSRKAYQFIYKVMGQSTSTDKDIYTKGLCIDSYGGSIVKIGIQAPPGTRFYLNNIPMQIGRSGMYELDDDIEVTGLYFLQTQKIQEIDSTQDEKALENAMGEMEEAKSKFQEDVKSITSTGKVYWEAYKEAHDKYIEAYNEAYVDYKTALYGYYTFSEVKDIDYLIIDYVVEGGSN